MVRGVGDTPYVSMGGEPPKKADKSSKGSMFRRIFKRRGDESMKGRSVDQVKASPQYKALAEMIPTAAQALLPGGKS